MVNEQAKVARMRGFEVIAAYEGQGITLPQRQTKQAAGYDLQAAEDMVLPSVWKAMGQLLFQGLNPFVEKNSQTLEDLKSVFKPRLVPTGIKAYMQADEYLEIVNRSSGSYKHFTCLPNGVGIIDADYYNNAKNEGHIYVQLINFGLQDRLITKGERIGQAIFHQFLIADQDQGGLQERTGGFGSSDLNPDYKE